MMVLSERDFDTVRQLVKEHAALVLEPGRAYLVGTRLAPVARGEGLGSLGALVARLREEPFGPVHAKVVDAVTTHETSFFRDLHPFDALRKGVLPRLLRARAMEKKLHVWCAASSSGQEAYTIALVLREYFPELRDWTVSLVATDLSEEMLERARRGRFDQLEINRGLPSALLVKYFTKIGSEWELCEDLRRMVSFQRQNLVKPWPPMPPLDVVFLRNVMLYFDREAQREILGRIRRVLQPDGILFLGATETTLGTDAAFERVAIEQSWAYRLRP